MLGVEDFRQTRLGQELLEEGREEGRVQGKMDIIPALLKVGLTVEAIAKSLKLEVEQVQQAANELRN